MLTGDGLLVRIHPALGRLAAAQAVAIAVLSSRYGNGEIDVTGRGNLQLRGLTAAGQAPLIEEIERLGLIEPDEPGPYRLTLVSPLAGLDETELFDSAAAAVAIEEACQPRSGLPDKFVVTVDGGGRFPLDSIAADLRFVAAGQDRVAVALAGATGLRWIGTLAPTQIVEAARLLIAALASELSITGGRARSLPHEAHARIERALAGRHGPILPPVSRGTPPLPGLVRTGPETCALVVGLPFGRCNADQLAMLAASASELRISPTRAIVLPGLPEREAARILPQIKAAGLIVDGADPRIRINACVGGPRCASGRTEAASDASLLAAQASQWLDAPGSLHVSGCAKGCAQAGPAKLTLVGSQDGRYGIVLGGVAADASSVKLPLTEIARHLGRLGRGQDVGMIFGDAG